MKKYSFTGISMIYKGHILNQIQALVDIPDRGIKANDLGGWLESDKNMSQEGTCWATGETKVMDRALICDDAFVKDSVLDQSAKVSETARVINSYISGCAEVFNEALVFSTELKGSAKVYGKVAVSHGKISGNTTIC